MRTLHLGIHMDIPGLTQKTHFPLSGIHTDIPEIREKKNAKSSSRDSYRYLWAARETQAPKWGIGRRQKMLSNFRGNHSLPLFL